jgi:hypothetical protein
MGEARRLETGEKKKKKKESIVIQVKSKGSLLVSQEQLILHMKSEGILLAESSLAQGRPAFCPIKRLFIL